MHTSGWLLYCLAKNGYFFSAQATNQNLRQYAIFSTVFCAPTLRAFASLRETSCPHRALAP